MRVNSIFVGLRGFLGKLHNYRKEENYVHFSIFRRPRSFTVLLGGLQPYDPHYRLALTTSYSSGSSPILLLPPGL